MDDKKRNFWDFEVQKTVVFENFTCVLGQKKLEKHKNMTFFFKSENCEQLLQADEGIDQLFILCPSIR